MGHSVSESRLAWMTLDEVTLLQLAQRLATAVHGKGSYAHIVCVDLSREFFVYRGFDQVSTAPHTLENVVRQLSQELRVMNAKNCDLLNEVTQALLRKNA